jgi:hypothetical protein
MNACEKPGTEARIDEKKDKLRAIIRVGVKRSDAFRYHDDLRGKTTWQNFMLIVVGSLYVVFLCRTRRQVVTTDNTAFYCDK